MRIEPQVKISLLDKLIGYLSPQRGLDRARAKLLTESTLELSRSGYDSADRTRETADWTTSLYAADSVNTANMDYINARAREHVRNSGIATSIVSAYRRHVVGTGIGSRATARNPITNEALSDYNKQIDILFEDWATDPKQCDVEGYKTFYEIQGLLIDDFITVGECFVVLNFVQSENGIGLQLQCIEVEQLDNLITSYTDPQTKQTNSVKHGIELNEFGRAVAYHIYTKNHPLDYSSVNRFNSERIPADRVLHYVRQDRVRASHGISRLAPVLKALWHHDQYETYQMIRARIEACVGGVICQDGKSTGADSWPTPKAATTNAQGEKQITMQPGLFPILKPGQSLQSFIPESPGKYYADFVQRQLTQIASGAGSDYNTVSRDYSNGTYSGLRLGKLESDTETEPLQQLMIHQILRPIRNAFVQLCALQSVLPMPQYFDSLVWKKAYESADWQPPAKQWIDLEREVNAYIDMVANGFMTRKQLVNMLGGDIFENIDEIADEKKYATDKNVIFPDYSEQQQAEQQIVVESRQRE